GAATGAIITGITALVEKDHISCKVGDGLNSVSLGKSLTIDSLKDFYVKWNLHLPDSAVPSANGSNATYANSLEAMCFNFQHRNTPVVFEKDWNEYCHTFDKDQNGCKKASVYYETQGNLVNNACVVSGGNECILNKKAFDAAGH
nr:hypothetical protein [Candidatus Enterousia merdequi]